MAGRRGWLLAAWVWLSPVSLLYTYVPQRKMMLLQERFRGSLPYMHASITAAATPVLAGCYVHVRFAAGSMSNIVSHTECFRYPHKLVRWSDSKQKATPRLLRWIRADGYESPQTKHSRLPHRKSIVRSPLRYLCVSTTTSLSLHLAVSRYTAKWTRVHYAQELEYW